VATVSKYRMQMILNPGLMFQLPILVQTGPRKYRCEFCSDTRPTREKGMRHVVNHFMSVGWAKTAPLDGAEKLSIPGNRSRTVA